MPTPNFKEEIAKDMAESGFNVHNHLKDLTVPELRTICDSERSNFSLCTISVTGDMNIGSIIRTASLFGAQAVHIVGRRRFDRRGLVGSNNYIDIHFHDGLNDDLTIDPMVFYHAMMIHSLTPIFVEQGGKNLGSFSWREELKNIKNPCLVVGNENRGIPDNILAFETQFLNAFRVSIPQRGVIRSHNVSVASGIVMSNFFLEMEGV